MTRRSLAAGAVAGLCVLAGTAAADDGGEPAALARDVELSGRIGADAAKAADGAAYRCYALDTKAGEQVSVEMTASAFTPSLWVSRGGLCSAATPQLDAGGAEGSAKVSFRAGGGRYLILARAEKGGGAFRISARTATASPSKQAAAVAPVPSVDTPTGGDAERRALMRAQVSQRRAADAAIERQRLAEQRAREEAARQARLAEQRRQEERSAMFGAALRGLAMGVSGIDAPLMNPDGSSPNTLDVLNAANAELARQNAEGKARLDATIAYAQRQAERERREQAELAEAERQRAAEARAQKQQGEQQQLATARQPEQSPPGQRTAGQGRLGQTPLGGVPAPVAAPPGGAAPTQLAQQQAGRAQICLEGRVLGAHNVRCEDPAKKSGSPADQGTTGGASSVGRGGGGTTIGGGTTPPGTRPPPGQTPGGGGAVEYVQRLEGVTLCELTGPQAQFKNWRCTGPLQMNYVNFEKANWTSAMLSTCGGRGPVRDLGTAGGYRAFGCGHAIDAAFHTDVPARFGVGYVPGRITYRCRKDRTSCVR